MIEFFVCDIETLGEEPPAAVIELCWNSLEWDEQAEQATSAGILPGSQLFGIPEGQVMTADNRAVHHIDPDELLGLPLFNMQDWQVGFDSDYTVAHNAGFEAKWLNFDVPWICTYKCALRLYPNAPSHSNNALKYYLGIPNLECHHPPHRALPDAMVTTQVLLKILETGTPVETLLQWSREPRLMPRCPIGKFKGKPWAEVEWGFLEWMLKQADMEHDLKWNAQNELDRRKAG